jgi:hypothetical protein
MRGGLGVMFAWVSLEVHPRIEQQEQRDTLQVLHRGQEQLRRNIKRVELSLRWRIHCNNTGKKRGSQPVGRHDLSATMESCLIETSRARGRWTLERYPKSNMSSVSRMWQSRLGKAADACDGEDPIQDW